MFVQMTATVSAAIVSEVMTRAITKASKGWLELAKCEVMQVRPEGAFYTSPAFWESAFLVKFTCLGAALPRGQKVAGLVHYLDDKRLARAIAIMVGAYPVEWARVVTGKGKAADADLFLQVALFGFQKFGE